MDMMPKERKESLQKHLLKPVAQKHKTVELLETTHPLLIAYLLFIRKLKSIHNKMDNLNQNSRKLSIFIYQCEHNLLFFLTITAQYNKIQCLFKNKSKPAKIGAIKRIMKRRRRKLLSKKAQFYSLQIEKRINFFRSIKKEQEKRIILLVRVHEEYSQANRYRFFMNLESGHAYKLNLKKDYLKSYHK
ncbi:MAG: hypothetical protein QM652_12965 [Legionella sp.]|uniref:hypothetical protein n=1 Tax=Legionella sp. TaxID=459 RepID=UPI0039E6FE2C